MPPRPRPTLLLAGVDGQLGWELRRTLAPLGAVVGLARADLDLRDTRAIDARVRGSGARVIVNAAAYTDVDRAETERDAAFAVNAVAPGALARAAAATGALLVHFSTDYVFDGRGRAPYREGDRAAPLNVYGESKLEGERAVSSAGGPHLILRTSWLYGLRGRNFLRTVLRLANEPEELTIVDDQIGCPTWCRMVAEAAAGALARLATGSEFLLPPADAGVHHLCSAGRASWYDFATAILEEAPGTAAQPRLRRIATRDFPRPAARPAFSVLDCARFDATFGIRLPDWREQLRLALASESAGAFAPDVSTRLAPVWRRQES